MSYTQEEISALVQSQRDYFLSGETLDIAFRLRSLKKLKKAILSHEEELTDALKTDLGRSETEAYLCDIGPTIMEINEIISHLRRWAHPETHFSGLLCFPSLITKVYKMPYGVSLIISPFNFPVLLTFGVLAAALSGGNTAVIKTSTKSPDCTRVMQNIIAETFPSRYCALVDGGHDVADFCLAERFDKIFYTGSPNVGKHVLRAAAENLTPAALELGGETGNWCVVRKDADLRDAARKIAFFKLCNSGQICININQVAIAEEVADDFIACLREEYARQIGENAQFNPEYPHLISESAYRKCEAETDAHENQLVFGGEGDPATLRYAPTVFYPVSIDDPAVQREQFSPLLFLVPFKDDRVGDMLDTIARREHGLSLYLFTRDKAWAKKVMSTQQYGGGCVNEVCLQLMVKGVPFNGTGHSGMGAYHGEWGFREFTHPSTVLWGQTRIHLPLREHPYNGKKLKMFLIRLFER